MSGPEHPPESPGHAPDPHMQQKIIKLKVNGDCYTLAVSPHWTLVQVLREHLHLTGTKLGCGTGDCGACTVIMNGVTVNSCLTLAVEADGAELRTIEGIAPSGDELHPVQEAFITHGSSQCGFCTPGMVVSSVHLIEKNPTPSEPEVRHAIGGNICRCTGYTKIVEAVLAASTGDASRTDTAGDES